MKKLIIGMLLLMLAVSACANAAGTPQATEEAAVISPDSVVAEGKLEPLHAANLTFQVRGVVETVNVKVGDTVEKGTVLAQLANADLAVAQVTAAKLELLNAQDALATLDRTGSGNLAKTSSDYLAAQTARAVAERAWEALDLDTIDDEIEDAESAVKDRETDLKDAQEEFDKFKDLDKDNARRQTAEDELTQAQDDYNEAVRKLEETQQKRDIPRSELDAALAAEAEAKHQFELSANGANADQVTFAQARLENAQAQIAAAEDALASYQIVAPFDGVVADVAVKAGEQVGTEARAVSVVDASAWLVETTDVTELEVVKLQVGQAATLTPDALPDLQLKAVITEISSSSFTQGGDVIYTVHLQLTDGDPRLKWGMTVEAIFEPSDN